MAPDTQQLTKKDFASETKSTWCPGCGDFGVLSSLQGAVAEMGLTREETVIVSGIGCSSNLPHFMSTYGIHSIHGRLLPLAMGIKLANPDLTVIGTGGDGDGYAIGAGHFAHACRRNVDMTYIVMDNQIYGLTTGQTSPTTNEGHMTKSTPAGNIEPPFNPLGVAVAEGATFVARGYSGDPKNLQQLIKQGTEHKGFALIDVWSPCVTYNKVNTYAWFRERVYNVNDPPEGHAKHDASDKTAAFALSLPNDDEVPYGIFYQETGKPTYDGQDATLAKGGRPTRDIKPRDVSKLVKAMI